jgi:hypothetical protein
MPAQERLAVDPFDEGAGALHGRHDTEKSMKRLGMTTAAYD